ncbi:hypothetical protein HanLR1_Chr10g0379111 [Helianthus annuus]|nr:hypothetical protein HanLR1_Chr10g0379111 [Helianthus annuus]
MEQKKLGVMRKVLKDYDIKDFKLHVLDKVRRSVPMLRSCYDMFLQDDDDSLATIFAIDGLFLLDLFHTYNGPLDEHLQSLKNKEHIAKLRDEERKHISEKDDEFRRLLEAVTNNELEEVKEEFEEFNQLLLKKRLVAQDILMVENQIPFMLLKEIEDILHSSTGNSSHPTNSFSPSVFRVYCEIHSPLKLCSKSQAPSSVDHLLHYMYYSIVNNLPGNQLPDVHKRRKRREDRESISQGHSFLSKLPQKEIVQVYEQTISLLETFTKNEVSVVSSASKLHDKSGFQFHSLKEDEGIQNIRIIGKDIYLPIITLNNDSYVILRNLVAYETVTANSDSFPFNEYMGLMCGLIITKDDAKYLKSQNVIIGDMGANEVAKLFTGMSSSIPTTKTKEKSKLRVEIDKINKVYESRLSMKTYLLLKKLARWLLVVLRGIGSFVESSWKIVAFMVSIVTVFMLTWQAYCDVYGCDKQTVTLLPYASS